MSVFSKDASNQIADEKAGGGQGSSSTRKSLLVAEASLGSLAAHPGGKVRSQTLQETRGADREKVERQRQAETARDRETW